MKIGMNRFHLSPQTIQFYSNAIRSKYAPGTFQRAKDIILSSLKWQFTLIYLVDSHIFQVPRRKYLPHTTITDASQRGWGNTEV